jgi:beta-glucanase (GH16 family)
MKKISLLLSCFTSLIFACSTYQLKAQSKAAQDSRQAPAETPALRKKAPKWKLVFSDKFNSKGAFDERKWVYSSRGNPAWARYLTASPEYVYQKGGKLLLKMDKANISGDSTPYHSAGIQSSGKFSFLYGKVEVRAKFTKGKGSWPAIWMMPEGSGVYGGWPNSGEIDIMEHVNNESKIHQTIHNRAVTNAKGASTATHQSAYNVDDFNTYGIIWNADAIEFYVNGLLQYTYAKPQGATFKEWPFDKPFYLILNQAGGAGWPGALAERDLPFEMQVDWVKVYQQK